MLQHQVSTSTYPSGELQLATTRTARATGHTRSNRQLQPPASSKSSE
jgi:hypothetical protein